MALYTKLYGYQASIQTDPIPLQREPTWSTVSSQLNQREEEPSRMVISQRYTSESIPAVTAENTLLSLDIVSITKQILCILFVLPIIIKLFLNLII